MLKSSLCDYSDDYIFVKGRMTIAGAGDNDQARQKYERNKGVIFKNYAPFTDCISEINNIPTDNAQYLDIIMLMYNFLEYNDNYSKISGSLWQYYRDESNANLTYSKWFESKMKIIGKVPAWW